MQSVRRDRYTVRFLADSDLCQLGVTVLRIEKGDTVVIGIGNNQQ